MINLLFFTYLKKYLIALAEHQIEYNYKYTQKHLKIVIQYNMITLLSFK